MTPVLEAVLLLTVTLVMVEAYPDMGKFTAADGAECNWFDLRLSSEKAALATACVCKDQQGNSQSYGCQYSGDLYTCDSFNKDSRQIFEELVQQLTGTEFNLSSRFQVIIIISISTSWLLCDII